jgi:drug/metabolite transporter (DMT)-like permease
MSTLIALAVAAVLAFPVTALMCRRRIAHKKKVGVLTTLLGALIPAACMTIPIYFCEVSSRHHGFALIQVVFINALGFSIIPAIVTAVFYQARNHDVHDA